MTALKQMRLAEIFTVVLAFIGLLFALRLCTGCSSPHVEPAIVEKRAKNAITQDEYRRELDACRAKGKATKAYDVYEACASELDAKYEVK